VEVRRRDFQPSVRIIRRMTPHIEKATRFVHSAHLTSPFLGVCVSAGGGTGNLWTHRGCASPQARGHWCHCPQGRSGRR
jgi:hypothetical protein